jgi:hypothetical protein
MGLRGSLSTSALLVRYRSDSRHPTHLAAKTGAEKVGRVHLAEALSYRSLVDEVRRAA